MTRRSNPSRSVPHPRADGGEPLLADPVNKRRKVDQTAQSHGRRRKATELATQSVPKGKRVQGERGSFPVDAAAPKRPVLLMLYPDVLEQDLGPAPVYGQYPMGFIEKILPWMQCERRRILHVCSGALPRGEGIRVDIRPEARPDIIADGRALPFADGSIEAVLIDPPYTEHYARELYGVKYPRPKHLLIEAARVVRPGGRIGFVHYNTPKPPPGTRCVRVFGMSTGFDMPMRAFTVYERDQASLPGMEETP
jgi:SAM-dependent methyltransferase